MVAATELVQTKRDLGRTKYAERIQKQRQATKKHQRQPGGVLTVKKSREMVRRKEVDEVARAQKVLDACYKRSKKAAKEDIFRSRKNGQKMQN